MSVPKQKRASSARNRRRSHHTLGKKGVSACPSCKKPIMGHRACPHCGVYKGKDTLVSKQVARKKKRERIKAV